MISPSTLTPPCVPTKIPNTNFVNPLCILTSDNELLEDYVLPPAKEVCNTLCQIGPGCSSIFTSRDSLALDLELGITPPRWDMDFVDAEGIGHIDTARTIVYTVTSPLGQVVNVYPECKKGTCTCAYHIGGVKSQLRPCRFASIILDQEHDYAEKYLDLLWYITDGCPIVDGPVDSYECKNYLSITCHDNRGKMDEIVRKELSEGMISQVSVKPICIHALGAVPKGNGGIRHITDCSRPESKSVNSHCGNLLKEFCFKSVEDVISVLEPGDFLTVVDIKAAYRSVPIMADHRKFQGFNWTLDGVDGWYQDNRLCFGLRLGPMFFNYISTFIFDVLTVRGLTIVNYLDDFIAVSRSYSSNANDQNVLIGVLRFLGFHIAFDKLVNPSTCVTYLGIEIDSVEMEVRLPEGKLAKLKSLLSSAIACKRISRKELESLGGSLSHCSHVVRGGKVFCRSVYSLYRTMVSQNKRFISVPNWVKADLLWWFKLSKHFNGVSKIVKVCYEQAMVSDSSFKGFGVYLGNDWCAGTWHDDDCILLSSPCNHVVSKPLGEPFDSTNINVLELWPVLVGLKRWAHLLRDKSIIVFTDNTQVLFMLLNGKSSNATCMQWIREIFWVCSLYNIELKPKYINTKNNLVADTLSRLPYHRVGDNVENLLSGSGLCCLKLLFKNYRADQ